MTSQSFPSIGLLWVLLIASPGILALDGCTTTPKNFAEHTDAQLIAEYEKINRKIANVETQYNDLVNQGAYATTQEQATRANFAAAILGIQLSKLYADRKSALDEAQSRTGAHTTTTSTPGQCAPETRSVPAPPPPPSSPPKSVPAPAPRSALIISPVYPGSAEGHWISDVFSSGRYILPEDGSVWEIDSFDTFDTTLWLATESIIVTRTPYKGYVFYNLINTDSGDKVQATHLGQAAFHSHIQDKFEGWKGETVFILDNGHVLQQATYAYTYHYAYRPEVLVINAGGYYRLMVDGVEETIAVVVLK